MFGAARPGSKERAQKMSQRLTPLALTNARGAGPNRARLSNYLVMLRFVIAWRSRLYPTNFLAVISPAKESDLAFLSFRV